MDNALTLTLPTAEDIAQIIKVHPYLKGLLETAEDIAGYVEERIIRICPSCTCWCAEEDFQECVGWCPVDGPETETRDTCRWCREDAQ
jgi:hypothetical protein